MERRTTRRLYIGGVSVGGGAPVRVQSMTNIPTADIEATVEQIRRLERAGCEIVRLSVPDEESARAIGEIKRRIGIPLIADIHFNWRLAMESIECGADGLRLNPGNIGSADRVREVVSCALERRVPIRIGVNSGSLEKDLLEKYGHPTPEAMVESALRHVRILEDEGFQDIKVSLKASDLWTTIGAYRLMATKVDYPLHVGITEAGTIFSGTVKSATGIGILLAAGIGDTIRVSLTADPAEEVRVGWEILKALGLRKRGVNVIACPTCGRIKIDCIELAQRIERALSHISTPLNVAVMGCVVNGPGEALHAHVAIAGGNGVAMLYVEGRPVEKLGEDEVVERVVKEVERLCARKERTTEGLQ